MSLDVRNLRKNISIKTELSSSLVNLNVIIRELTGESPQFSQLMNMDAI